MTAATLEDHRRFHYNIAERIAPTWERRRAEVEEASAPVREWMIRELAPHPGDTVLELAAGIGDTGFEAAVMVGEEGHVITSDFSPAMLAAALRRGTELGLSNVEYRILDAEHIDLDADSVDGVLCRFGYMLMADPAAAFAETRRVLRPGHRVALAVWGAPERNPLFGAIALALIESGHLDAPDPNAPGPHALASPERVTELLSGAGFAETRAEEVAVCFAVPDINEYVRLMADTAGPIALALQALSGTERKAVTAACEPVLGPFRLAGGYEIPGITVCAVAS